MEDNNQESLGSDLTFLSSDLDKLLYNPDISGNENPDAAYRQQETIHSSEYCDLQHKSSQSHEVTI